MEQGQNGTWATIALIVSIKNAHLCPRNIKNAFQTYCQGITTE